MPNSLPSSSWTIELSSRKLLFLDARTALWWTILSYRQSLHAAVNLSIMYITTYSTPFLFHIILETPAAIAFALFPSATLRTPQIQAHAVIRQYALLIWSTVLISAAFACWSNDLLSLDPHTRMLEHQVAGALALYHLGPLARAGRRMWDVEGRCWRAMPCLHLLSHGACGMALAGRAYDLW